MTDADWIAYGNEHLKYEAVMYLTCLDVLHHTPGRGLQMNLALQGCAIHLRNLIDFFYAAGRSDDVTANDFSSGWVTRCLPITPDLERAKERANKELAHLTLKRIAGVTPEKAWNFDYLRNELRPVIQSFLSSLDPQRVPCDAVEILNRF